jgi:hypothetical protein
MNVTMTYVTVAAQPGWFLTVFTSSGGIDRYEPIIAWEIQRTKRPNGLVTRFPIPITAESKNTDLDCAIWGIKRPDGKFVFLSEKMSGSVRRTCRSLPFRWNLKK